MSMFDGENNTVKNFKKFYDAIYPYLSQKPATGFTPVGTVISVMATSAPEFYLSCDGAEHAIVEYPELADHFEKNFGAKNFFGGNGTTTFAVPDLRGEFLRGTGTNSHANQGSGANVGVHQDSSKSPIVYEDGNVLVWYGTYVTDGAGNMVLNTDSSSSPEFPVKAYTFTPSKTRSTTFSYVTSRPTNTSVLYCIAYKNIFIDVKQAYSLNERVVGTWIDGSKIYQKTFTCTIPNGVNKEQDVVIDCTSLNIKQPIDILLCHNGTTINVGTSGYQHPTPNNSLMCWFNLDTKKIYVRRRCTDSTSVGGGATGFITFSYTKTTD